MDDMSEMDRAAAYEAEAGQSGGESSWEDVPPTPRRRLNSMVSVRLTPEEVATIRAAAEDEGVSVSAYLRSAALGRAKKVPGDDRPALRAVPNETVGTITWGEGTAGVTGLPVEAATWSTAVLGATA